ncbi:MAG TPA: hypothetical protein VKW04_17445 [Planctomycetota bacterium]|nr:hypothetical protein [Planctomycetota bacterium]
MKQLILAALVLALASCARDDDSLKYEKVRVDRYQPDIHIEPQGTCQYMAFCADEGRALSDWVDSRSEAQSKASDYHSEHPDRECMVLWREKPTGRLVPKSQ